MNSGKARLIIAGGGLAGGLAALALARRRPEIDILIIDQDERFGGNHTWSFFDGDVAQDGRWLIDPVVTKHWPGHEIRFPQRRRRLGFGYNSVRSEEFDQVVRSTLRPDQYRLGSRITEVQADHVLLESGERLDANGIIDARGPRGFEGLDLGWQKFVGRTYRFSKPHCVDLPIIMDATVDQRDGYRFVYSLPFSETELMVEDTYYSNSSQLQAERLGTGLDAMIQGGHAVAEETGVLPVLLGGKLEALWPADAPPVAKLGLRGGFFHPTTGYSLPDAVSNALLLAQQPDFTGPALYRLFHRRAEKLWQARSFFQLLNRMLFRAAAPEERYRVLQHFYRLPEPLIARFYAGRLTALDKLRILSGRPPVPVGRALSAMRSAA